MKKAGIVNTSISLVHKGTQEALNTHAIASIRVTPDAFSYALFNPETSQYYQLESFDLQGVTSEERWKETLRELFEEHPVILEEYAKTYLQWAFPGALLVPAPLYTPQKKKLYFKYNYDTSPKQLIHEDLLPSFDAVLLYPIASDIDQFLQTLFPKAIRTHHLSNLLLILKKGYCSDQSSTQLFVQVNKNSFDLILFRQKELQFLNTFPYKTAEDFLYFLLLTMKTLSLDTETQKVTLLGAIASDAILTQKIANYIRHIQFITKSPYDHFSETFNQVEEHLFFNLLNQKNCE
ncbi:MAG: hypothetical protein CSA95_07085 [Bacteroidetes bacterium]|nr:MAG: hypothetical protein CSA95_07085 [Bacteroidota bacterium]PIE88024.1 MAG: hypothetical protein CSA04_04000 [Bacteroidota bacterium]